MQDVQKTNHLDKRKEEEEEARRRKKAIHGLSHSNTPAFARHASPPTLSWAVDGVRAFLLDALPEITAHISPKRPAQTNLVNNVSYFPNIREIIWIKCIYRKLFIYLFWLHIYIYIYSYFLYMYIFSFLHIYIHIYIYIYIYGDIWYFHLSTDNANEWWRDRTIRIIRTIRTIQIIRIIPRRRKQALPPLHGCCLPSAPPSDGSH